MASENPYIPERPRPACARFSPTVKNASRSILVVNLSVSAGPTGPFSGYHQIHSRVPVFKNETCRFTTELEVY
jgi:hypothetical protein